MINNVIAILDLETKFIGLSQKSANLILEVKVMILVQVYGYFWETVVLCLQEKVEVNITCNILRSMVKVNDMILKLFLIHSLNKQVHV